VKHNSLTKKLYSINELQYEVCLLRKHNNCRFTHLLIQTSPEFSKVLFYCYNISSFEKGLTNIYIDKMSWLVKCVISKGLILMQTDDAINKLRVQTLEPNYIKDCSIERQKELKPPVYLQILLYNYKPTK
jgi:hypothetical protein